MTANDVRFSLRRLKNLKDNPSFFMDPVKDIQAVDDLTVRIVLSAPDASFLSALAAVPCGVADSKVVMAKGGTDADDAKDKDKATEWLNNQSEGSGPTSWWRSRRTSRRSWNGTRGTGARSPTSRR